MRKLLYVSPFFLVLSFFIFVLPSPINAFEFRKGERINLPANESIDGSLFVAGQEITIESNIDGDLYCAGQEVRITGEITGDVLCAAQDLEITGSVNGNIRSVAQTLLLDAPVSRNVNLFGQDLILGSSTRIAGELYTAGERVTVNGVVLKSWGGTAEHITLNGRVSQEALLATTDLTLSEDATVAGGITRVEMDKDLAAHKKMWQSSKILDGFKFAGKVTSLMLGLLYGFLILWLFPDWLKKAGKLMETMPAKNALWGTIIWLVTPILIVLSAITIVGIPLALVMGLALILLGGLTWVVAAAALGNKLLPKSKFTWGWLAGYLLLSVVSWLPVVGGLIALIVVLVGTGAIKFSLLHSQKKKK